MQLISSASHPLQDEHRRKRNARRRLWLAMHENDHVPFGTLDEKNCALCRGAVPCDETCRGCSVCDPHDRHFVH